MKLVITYHVSDGYTYSCEVIEALEYDSAEAFIIHFEEKIQEYMRKTYETKEYVKSEFVMAGVDFDASNFILVHYEAHPKSDKIKYTREVELPTVETLDEWFDRKKPTIICTPKPESLEGSPTTS